MGVAGGEGLFLCPSRAFEVDRTGSASRQLTSGRREIADPTRPVLPRAPRPQLVDRARDEIARNQSLTSLSHRFAI
jgi:hypothetical protein